MVQADPGDDRQQFFPDRVGRVQAAPRAQRQGELAVRVEGQDGKCFGERKVTGVNSTRLEVGALAVNMPFTLTFVSTGGAKLYSFWTGGADGRSGGYLAGGSPESATLRDVQ